MLTNDYIEQNYRLLKNIMTSLNKFIENITKPK